MTVAEEFHARATRLATVLRAEGCPGLIVGISGTDSVIAFLLAADALRQMGQPERLLGIHFGAPAPDPNAPTATRALALGAARALTLAGRAGPRGHPGRLRHPRDPG